MPAAQDILNDFGEKLVKDLQQSLRNKGVTFGGGGDSRLSASIKFDIKYTQTGISFNLLMPDYAYWVDHGRRPGPVSKEGQKKISTWAQRKGLVGKFQTENLQTRMKAHEAAKRKLKKPKKISFAEATKELTFLIARKIKRKGYKATHFAEDVLKDGRVQELQQQLAEAFKREILVTIKTE